MGDVAIDELTDEFAVPIWNIDAAASPWVWFPIEVGEATILAPEGDIVDVEDADIIELLGAVKTESELGMDFNGGLLEACCCCAIVVKIGAL